MERGREEERERQRSTLSDHFYVSCLRYVGWKKVRFFDFAFKGEIGCLIGYLSRKYFTS